MAEKIFVGSTREFETRYGKIYKTGFTEADLEKLRSNMDGGWVNVELKQGKSGNWYIEIVPRTKNNNNQPQPPQAQTYVASPDDDDDDLPF